ncbi:hypothetical protein [Amaricoccus solimangrovi]|uniref:hypothetical protein n=1 Tax=Amaricoccus solimangrovi TaxID=2589815 RepID=UPI001F1B3272|nr:hypothetical protein [Amaricoccus solimangrovi]
MTATEQTSDRLRKDIDRGRAGDKVNWPDPAAAPLGTDDEAAGTPPTEAQIRHAREMEVRGRPADTESGLRPTAPAARGSALGWILGLGAAVLVLILAFLWI